MVIWGLALGAGPNDCTGIVFIVMASDWKKNTDIREKEKKLLEKSAYMQSLSFALTPIIPVIAIIVTFLAHVASGYNLTTAEVSHRQSFP